MSEAKISSAITDKARTASVKPAPLGEDLDLGTYVSSSEQEPYQADVSQFSGETRDRMSGVGVILDSVGQRSGTYIQMNHTPVHSSVRQEGVEVMPLSLALMKYDWLRDYCWQAVPVDTDKYTANVELGQHDGYFIRALPGTTTMLPVQACLYLTKARLAQKVHNIIIAEEGSELHIITGCTTALNEGLGLHIGVSEFYVKKNARVTFTMIHSWNADTAVRPRTGVILEDNSLFLSNYILMRAVRSIQMNPLARCAGENAIVRFNNILVAGAGASLDIGSRVFLDARGARTEMVTRAISTGGDIISRGYIEGNAPDVKGHMECRGLILKKNGIIHAIPELKGTLASIDLSHEAAIGKIAQEEVEYLMARGLTRSQATAAIVRGFLRVDIEGLPAMLSAELQRATETAGKDLF